MPSKLLTTSYRAYLTRRQRAAGVTARQVIRGTAPYLGYTPDLPPELAGLVGAQAVSGLIADVAPGFGVVLRPDVGFVKFDPTPTRLPLGEASLPSTTTPRPVIRLDTFYRRDTAGAINADQASTLMAITEGDGSTPESNRLYRLDPQNARWGDGAPGLDIAYSGAGTGATATRAGDTTSNKSMPDTCTVPFGITGTIAAPVWVWCNNFDRVYIYPNAAGAGGTYTDYPSGGLATFKARSVTTWINRVWFLNTQETGTRHSRRLRRSAALDGRIDPTVPGTGALDFTDFDGDGVAVRPLGDHLACYFQDGVGLVLRPTGGQPPIATRVLTRERGLLGTHCVTAVGSSQHFGIFTDGWFLLDASGQFQEVGLFSAGSQTLHTFRDTFYSSLDESRVHEIQVQYEPRTRYVRVAWPQTGVSDLVVWTLDMHSGAVWPMDWTATVFSTNPIQLTSSGIIGVTDDADGLSLLAPTIDGLATVAATIDALGTSTFGLETLVHGTEGGYVYRHDTTTRLRDGAQPAFNYRTHLIPGEPYLNLHTIDRVVMEYLGGGTATQVRLGAGTERENRSVNTLLQAEPGDLDVVFAWHRMTGTHKRLRFFGTGDIQVRGFELHSHFHSSKRRGLLGNS